MSVEFYKNDVFYIFLNKYEKGKTGNIFYLLKFVSSFDL